MTSEQHISFVIPAYNCADTLTEAVRSILEGNFTEGDEVIIVDDASTDDTPKVIAQLKTEFPFLILLRNTENKGCPATRNIGIRTAKNELIFNLDSDNILIPGSVEKLRKALLTKGADIAAFGQYRFFKGHDKTITHTWNYEYDTLTLADLFAGTINPGPGGNYLYTKESWEKIGGYWEYGKGLNEAWGFTFKQLVNGAKFIVVPHTYYLHRYGINSLFDRESKKSHASSRIASQMVLNYIDVLSPKDADYIRSEEGSAHWFENLSGRPIRVVSGVVGRTGYKASMSSSAPPSLARRIVRRLVPRSLRRSIITTRLKRKYVRDFSAFNRIAEQTGRDQALWKDRRPELFDNTGTTVFDAHYIYHPAWAARIVKRIAPAVHVDISSTLAFSSMLSAFIPVRYYDYRPANLTLSDLESGRADLTSLPFTDNSIESLSCMHTIEHIGLGRYGDPLDPSGDLKAIAELQRVLAKGGNLLFVVPIGKPRINFNAHRVYAYEEIVNYFKDFTLVDFSLVPDNGIDIGLIPNASKEAADAQTYGCGCFWFSKK